MVGTLGIDDEERERLAELYQPGQSLWRMPMPHFTGVDGNYNDWPPVGAETPAQALGLSEAQIAEAETGNQQLSGQGNLTTQDAQQSDNTTCPGSIIQVESQNLGEAIPISGTPFSLHYQSERTQGRTAAYTMNIPLSGASVPSQLQYIELEIQVAGQDLIQDFTPATNLSYSYTWNGQNAYGQAVQGSQPIYVRLSYFYPGTYQQTERFGDFGTPTRGG